LVDGRPLYEHLGSLIAAWGANDLGTYGYSVVGAVVGATFPEQSRRLRALMPHTFFLVPGYGAQGATAADVAGCFDTAGQGALINASRSVIFAYRASSRYGPEAYARAAREAAQAMTQEIQQALVARAKISQTNMV
jgi:orotidine-5'-phosphate decarboxylase